MQVKEDEEDEESNEKEKGQVEEKGVEEKSEVDEDEKVTVDFTEEDLEGMKRKDLQALCKKHDLSAGGKNSELVERLKSLL